MQLALAAKLSEGSVDAIDSWNSTQVFFMQDLAKAYGEYC